LESQKERIHKMDKNRIRRNNQPNVLNLVKNINLQNRESQLNACRIKILARW
jgi:hypothetical protein